MPAPLHARLLRPAATALVLLAALLVGSSGTATARVTAVEQTPPPEHAAQFGLTTGCCTPVGTSLLEQVPGYAATGAAWVRTGFDWSAMEATQGVRRWTRDDVVRSFTGRGMKVLGVVAYTPVWARDPDCTGGNKCAPQDAAAFAAFAADLAERYDGDGVADAPGSPKVDAWEIWNEPNLAPFWRPSPDPAAYAELLVAAYRGIKAAAPSATVVSAGLSPAGGPFAPVTYLSALYTAGAGGSFDALGFHPYSYPALPGKLASWNAWQQMSTAFPKVGQVDSLRSLMVRHGDGSKQIWATEYGAPTGGDTNGDGVSRCDADGVVAPGEDRCVTEERQAVLVDHAYRTWQTYDWAGPLFWYAFQDLWSGGPSIEHGFGLLRSDGSPKPAYRAYVDAVRAGA